MTKSSTQILQLVELALDEVDSLPLAVTTRRVVRIANLLGDSRTALRFMYEVKFTGGHTVANGEDLRRLMVDPSLWADEEGPAIQALNDFMADRDMGDSTGKIGVHTLDDIEWLLGQEGLKPDAVLLFRRFRGVTQGRVFAKLCEWERVLSASAARESALAAHESRVDGLLERAAPEVLTQFVAVFRRLNEAADAGLSITAGEELAQAVTTCRRILKAVVDLVQPVDEAKPTSDTGHLLNDQAYKNRLFEFLKTATDSGTHQSALTSAGQSLWERFDATDSLSSKGVHADVARDEAELCALNTYLVAGEVLRFWDRRNSGVADVEP